MFDNLSNIESADKVSKNLAKKLKAKLLNIKILLVGDIPFCQK